MRAQVVRAGLCFGGSDGFAPSRSGDFAVKSFAGVYAKNRFIPSSMSRMPEQM